MASLSSFSNRKIERSFGLHGWHYGTRLSRDGRSLSWAIIHLKAWKSWLSSYLLESASTTSSNTAFPAFGSWRVAWFQSRSTSHKVSEGIRALSSIRFEVMLTTSLQVAIIISILEAGTDFQQQRVASLPTYQAMPSNYQAPSDLPRRTIRLYVCPYSFDIRHLAHAR